MAKEIKYNLGGIVYNYIKARNKAIYDFNRYHFNRDFDGNFVPRPNCDRSEPIEPLDWDSLAEDVNKMSVDQAKALSRANSLVYNAYKSKLDEMVYSILDEYLGIDPIW